MLEQEFKEEFGVSGVVLGSAGGEGLAIPRQHEGIDGKEHKEIVLTQRRDDGALMEFETDGNRLPGNRVRKVLTHASMVSDRCSRR